MLWALIQNAPFGLKYDTIDMTGILPFTRGKIIVIFRSFVIFKINSNTSNINSIALRTNYCAKKRLSTEMQLVHASSIAKGL